MGLSEHIVTLHKGKNDCADWFRQGTGSAADIMNQVPIILYIPQPSPIPGEDAQATGDPKAPIEVSTRGRFFANSDNGLLVAVFNPGSFGARVTIPAS